MFKALVISSVLFVVTTAQAAQLKSLDCGTSNGVIISTLENPTRDNPYVTVQTQWGWSTKVFSASLTKTKDGSSAIILQREDELYKVSTKLNLKKKLVQRISGDLLFVDKTNKTENLVSKINCTLTLN